MHRKLKSLIFDRGGNFAVMAGLSALPIVLALGGGVDVARFYNVTQSAQDAADAATLAAAKRMETGTAQEAEADAQLYGKARLKSETTPITLVNVNVNVNVIDEKAGTVTTTAKGTFAPDFMKLANIQGVPFERVSVSTIKQKASWNSSSFWMSRSP